MQPAGPGFISMQRLPLPYLLLLPLLAVLLFGNCGLVSTRRALQEMNPVTQAALRASVLQRQTAREAARQHLRGPARREAYEQIEQVANQQADSIMRPDLGPVQDKFHNRRNKLERQLLRYHAPTPTRKQAEKQTVKLPGAGK